MIVLIAILSVLDAFEAANQLYDDGNYDAARQKYEQLISSGIKNGAVYYNLGNCHFKVSELGEAILQYRRAQKLIPGDPDVKFNLDFARARCVDDVKRVELPGAVTVFLELLKRPSINLLAVLGALLYFALVFFICASLFVKIRFNSELKIGLSVALIIVLALFFGNVRRLNAREGVLLANVAEVRSGPAEDYTLIFNIHEGMEVRVLAEQGQWSKITLRDGLEGWIKTGDMGEI
jgi:tetratricopeptide (TPR) repeat protein